MLVMAITFVLVIPMLGMLYVDMNNATAKAAQEISNMRKLRANILIEKRGEP